MTLLVIIASNISYEYEDKLLKVLRDKNIAIGWIIAGIKVLNPSICLHKIPLKDEREKCWLNHPMMDVVKKEILKWLDVMVIYPIFGSKCDVDPLG